MEIFEEAYQKAVKQNGCNAGETFALSMFQSGADDSKDRIKHKSIEAHWKCCPNLSKDNDQMCRHLADCNRECLYMTEFINQL